MRGCGDLVGKAAVFCGVLGRNLLKPSSIILVTLLGVVVLIILSKVSTNEGIEFDTATGLS